MCANRVEGQNHLSSHQSTIYDHTFHKNLQCSIKWSTVSDFSEHKTHQSRPASAIVMIPLLARSDVVAIPSCVACQVKISTFGGHRFFQTEQTLWLSSKFMSSHVWYADFTEKFCLESHAHSKVSSFDLFNIAPSSFWWSIPSCSLSHTNRSLLNWRFQFPWPFSPAYLPHFSFFWVDTWQ